VRRFSRPRLTFANVIACLALFIALGGTGYAAFKLPKGSVGTKQLKRGAVTTTKVKRGAINLAKIKASAKNRLGTNVVARVGPEETVNATSFNDAEAQCEPGEQATGGGMFSEDNVLTVHMNASYPTPNQTSPPAQLNGDPATGWRVWASNDSTTSNYKIQAYVLCAS
jgi:hypothetical protein